MNKLFIFDLTSSNDELIKKSPAERAAKQFRFIFIFHTKPKLHCWLPPSELIFFGKCFIVLWSSGLIFSFVNYFPLTAQSKKVRGKLKQWTRTARHGKSHLLSHLHNNKVCDLSAEKSRVSSWRTSFRCINGMRGEMLMMSRWMKWSR